MILAKPLTDDEYNALDLSEQYAYDEACSNGIFGTFGDTEHELSDLDLG